MSDILQRLRLLVPSDSSGAAIEAAAKIAALTAEVKKLRVENIQMQAALGYGILADDERHILPSNPFQCGTCGPKADAIAALTARVEELEGALGNLIKACDQGRMVPRSGVSGMTIEAQMRNSVLNGVPVWPVEEAREVWEQTREAVTKGEREG